LDALPQQPDFPPLDAWADDVDPAFWPLFTRIAGLTDAFCDAQLNNEYKELCRDMAAALCEPGSPMLKGKPMGWACGIVYTVGWLNFLSDPEQTPHLRSEQIAAGFGVSVGTMHAKSKVLREVLDLMPADPAWCLPSMLGKNPLVWMVQTVEGVIVDVRMLPRMVQEQAFRAGLIPFVPADDPKAAGVADPR
jgi:hypothetical protein